jgi:DNA-binding CsgD family transcriptional regulator
MERQKMIYEYVTVTGKQMIEVDERFYDILFAMDQEEYNSNRKHSRHCPISLSNADYDGDWMEDGTNMLNDLIQAEDRERHNMVLAGLSPSQRELIKAIAAGITPADYARQKNISKAAVSQHLKRIRKKFFEILR